MINLYNDNIQKTLSLMRRTAPEFAHSGTLIFRGLKSTGMLYYTKNTVTEKAHLHSAEGRGF